MTVTKFEVSRWIVALGTIGLVFCSAELFAPNHNRLLDIGPLAYPNWISFGLLMVQILVCLMVFLNLMDTNTRINPLVAVSAELGIKDTSHWRWPWQWILTALVPTAIQAVLVFVIFP